MDPLAALVEEHAQPAAIVDGHTVTRGNAALSALAGDFVGRSVLDLVIPEHRDALQQALRDGGRAAVGLAGARQATVDLCVLVHEPSRVVLLTGAESDATQAPTGPDTILTDLLELLPGELWHTDVALRLRSCNSAFAARTLDLHGVAPEPGAPIIPYAFRGTEDAWVALHTRALAGEALEHPFTSEAGEFTLSMCPTRDGQTITGVAAYCWQREAHSNEIAMNRLLEVELDEALRKAARASRAKSAFLANMSHELRTPLNAIMGYSEMLAEDADADGLTHMVEDLWRIHGAGTHLLDLINDILDLSKIESGKVDLVPDTFQVGDLVREVAAALQPAVVKKDNLLLVECDPRVTTVVNDPARLRQVVKNLISNAAKFTDNGEIYVDIVPTSEADIEIRVRDTGIGMTEEQVSRLFDDFEQADNSTMRKYGGAGLGLAICGRVVDMMGGRIEVESALGVGSTFRVCLPRVLPSEAPTMLPMPVTGTSLDGETPSILCIDEDETIRDIFKHMLEKEGVRVYSASSGDEGLRIAREKKPSAVTVDVMMQERSGWEVLHAFQNDPSLTDIPMFMVSLFGDNEGGMALGATNYVTKPVSRAKLLDAIQPHLQQPGDGVLVIEDDDDVRALVQRTLAQEGLAVRMVRNGRRALEELDKAVPSFVILDLMLPEMDGFGVLARMREDERLCDVPIVILAARDLTQGQRLSLMGHLRSVLAAGEFSRDKLLKQIQSMITTTVMPDD